MTTAMPLDPTADIGRRAWLPCPRCDHGAGCPPCREGRNCAGHWQYLLGSQGPRVFLQCPDCTHLWDFDPRADRIGRAGSPHPSASSRPARPRR